MALKKILLLFCGLLFFSCSYVNPGLLVFWGNYQMDQGNFKRANVAYLDALEWEYNESLVNYNIGNIYYSLGERDSALSRWEASDSEEREFLFMLTFNRGVYYYEKGRYEEAALAFREAVNLDPTDRDSKINLELSLSRVNAGLELRGDEPEQEKDEDLQDDTERLLNYLRRQESFTWEPAEKRRNKRENDW
ncbi:MAG: tetratricopeptide repeat protein [Spirochaetales bacterium]|nr:tetratricopeptide repeat protein [Spirochaetales bacterium]